MERLIRALAPAWALRRAVARARLDAVNRLYQAASPSHLRSRPAPSVSGNAVVDHARGRLRDWARHLDENHDLSHAALTILARQASAQTIIPTPRLRNGDPAESVAELLADEFAEWCEQADPSGQGWSSYCELIARSWLRDGEVFVVHDQGADGRLGYAIRAYEADYVPYDVTLSGAERRIVHGVELDDSERPSRYYLYRDHPEDIDTIRTADVSDLIDVPAELVSHIRTIRRLGQVRGVSVLAPAITRLADLAEYEGAEFAAAKIAAAVSVQITRSPDFVGNAGTLDDTSGERALELQAGMILDNLMPGEKYEVIDTSRPNPELSNFRRAMARAAASGMRVSYSSMAADYDGTYSSQRQELVEARASYAALQATWKAAFLRPVYRRFVSALQRRAAVLQITGLGRVDPATLFSFDAQPPEMPWIDPAKEAAADKLALDMGIESRHGVMRKRGIDPRRVDQERERDATQPAQQQPVDDPAEQPEESADAA